MGGTEVVPTRVGVDRTWSVIKTSRSPLSPHAWGWTDPHQAAPALYSRCPHTRGGGPMLAEETESSHVGCPHTRGGGPTLRASNGAMDNVVPTRVGVDRSFAGRVGGPRWLSPHAWGWTEQRKAAEMEAVRCPHTRGGGPSWPNCCSANPPVVPTRVGVDRTARASISGSLALSPHAWGWTGVSAKYANAFWVVPTRVGVDRPPGCG